jgi:hypothetical protein
MTLALFAQLTIGELAAAALVFAGVKAWRRFGTNRVLTLVALAALLGQLVLMLASGHSTPLAGGLALLALVSATARIMIDPTIRSRALPNRSAR